MIFDKLRAAVSRFMTDIMPVVESAMHIKFPYDPHKILPTRMDTWRLMSTGLFKLPYPIVAIEDPASCVVIADLQPDQRGLDGERLFIECVPVAPGVDESHYNDAPEAAEAMAVMCATMPKTAVIIVIGRFSSHAQRNDSYLVDGTVSHSFVCSDRELMTPLGAFEDLDDQGKRQTTESSLRNAMTAIEEIMFIESRPGFTAWPTLGSPASLTMSENGRIEVG